MTAPAPRMDFEPFLDEAARQYVTHGVDSHNIAATGLSDYFPVNLVLRGAAGDVLGGLLGQLWGGWLHVNAVWVSTALRGQGFGARLIAAAEAYACERGAVGAMLETYSFQARPFYERLGYEVFGTLEDCPPGHTKFHLKRTLA